MDIETAFLHCDLDEELYMKQSGHAILGEEQLVCNLKKSLCGLKQALRKWYKKFDAFILKHGFKRSHSDHCLYTKMDEDRSHIILVLYVDDMLLAGKKKRTLNALKQQLNSAFSMKDLGEAEHILGMQIKRDRQQYTYPKKSTWKKCWIDLMWLMLSLVECHCSRMLSFPRMIVPNIMMLPIT